MRANFRMNSSTGAFRSFASCTMTSIRASVLSLYGLLTMSCITRSVAIIPASTGSPLRMVRGRLSPVKAAVLNEACSFCIVPSRGTRSPAFISMSSFTFTVSGCTVSGCPLRITVAVSGRTSNRALIFRCAFPTARS